MNEFDRDNRDYKTYAFRTDRNQSEIVGVFRQLGCAVHCLHNAGEGVFDLLVGVDWLNCLVEVKDYLKPPSQRTFTPKQKKFNFNWPGLRAVVCTNDQAVALVAQLRQIVKPVRLLEKQGALSLSVFGSTEEQYKPSLY